MAFARRSARVDLPTSILAVRRALQLPPITKPCRKCAADTRGCRNSIPMLTVEENSQARLEVWCLPRDHGFLRVQGFLPALGRGPRLERGMALLQELVRVKGGRWRPPWALASGPLQGQPVGQEERRSARPGQPLPDR